MDRASRQELLKTNQALRDQVQKYENKLRDVVSAYKGLSKEKEALQASIQALTATHTHKDDGRKKQDITLKKQGQGEDQADHGDGKDVPTDPLTSNEDITSGQTDVESESDADSGLAAASESEESENAEISRLREQLGTLTASLNTVMQEKSKLEAQYQAEKKHIRHEHAEIVKAFEDQHEKHMSNIQELTEQLQEMKTKFRNHQHEREREQNDHAMMLRELQRVMAQERAAKEQLEQQLEETKQALWEKENVPDVSVEYERRIENMSSELESVRVRLKATEEQSTKPSPMLIQVQKEMAEIKAQHRIAMQQEQQRANDAEEKMKNVAAQGEARISSLETKLSELSEVVGNYERLRQQDQTALQRFRERVSQLDMENTALARTAHKNAEIDNPNDESNLSVQSLIDKIMHFKGLLKLANEKSEKPMNIEELLQSCELNITDDNIHKLCRDEYSTLKEEFERYKLRAQSVLKNKTTKDVSNIKEADTVRAQVIELKERIRSHQREQDELEDEHKQVVDDMRRTITCLHEKHRQDMAAAEVDYKKRAHELETQLHKHRDRTIALLIEKDKEIEKLRTISPEREISRFAVSSQPEEVVETTKEKEDSSEETAAVSHLLSRPAGGVGVESTLLHFTEELGRMKVELNTLRKHKRQLENTLREMELNNSTKEDKYKDQIALLKEEILKMERDKSREGANLEYLKNVVFQYMVCTDQEGRHKMFNAISIILQFSPQEKKAVNSFHQSWWAGSYSSSHATPRRK